MAINLLAISCAIAFLYVAKNLCIPIVLSIFLFFLLDPLVANLEKRSIPRMVTSPLLVFLMFSLLLTGAWGVFLITSNISGNFPEYSAKLKTLTSYFAEKITVFTENSVQIFPKSSEVQKVEVVDSMGDMTSTILSWLDAIAGMFGSIFMVPILSLFLLLERNKIAEKLQAFASLSQNGASLAKKISRVIQGFFVGNLLAGIASSMCFFAAFAVLGLDNKLALSVGAGFLNIIPIVGAFLAVTFPLAQGLLQFNSLTPFLVIIAYSLVVHFIIGNFVLPKLMGSRVDLNITAATLGMLFWGWLWGALGIFLAVPIVAVIKVLCSANTSTKSLANLLSDSDEKPSSFILVDSFRFLKNLRNRKA